MSETLAVPLQQVGRHSTPAPRPVSIDHRADAAFPVDGDDASDTDRLMQRVSCGDVGAFEEVVGRCWQRTFVFAQYLTHDSDVANDVAQETFARLWERRRKWDPSGSVQSWLFRTARNYIISEVRKEQVREKWVRRSSHEVVDRPPTPLEEVEVRDTLDEIGLAIAALTPRRREAFILFHVQGLSYRESAEVMSVRPQTVANYLQAALEDLRQALGHVWPLNDRSAASAGTIPDPPE
jgi:RNA polymerase sigma-70 factor (family 1)